MTRTNYRGGSAVSMDGTRFGVGLALGLLLAIGVVVAASGGVSASLQQMNPGSAANTPATTTATMTGSKSLTSVVYGTTNGSQVPSTNVGNTSSAQGAIFAVSALPSSSLAAVASQSPASDSLLLVPILLAFVLGAVIYRASLRDTAQGTEG